MQDVLLLATDQVDDLIRHLFWGCAWKIDLVQHRNDLQIVLERQVQIGNGLGLYALGGINDQ